jgi:hypothetical protein
MSKFRRCALVAGVLAACACAAPQREVDDSEVTQQVASRSDAIKTCYEAALARDPTLNGRVALKYIVGTGGAVTSVEVSSEDAELNMCIRAKLLAIQDLPILKEPKEFKQSFQFAR